MEEITITLKPPITEYCNKCDYEECYSFNATRCKCPLCGEESVHMGARPDKNMIKVPIVTVNRGSYDWAHPSDDIFSCAEDLKTIQQDNYCFHNLPEGLSRNYTVSIEHELDTDDIFSCAEDLKTIFEGYLYSSNKDKIKKVVEWLNNNADEIDTASIKEKRRKLERDLYKHIYMNGEES